MLALLQPNYLLAQQQLDTFEKKLARVDARELACLALADLFLLAGGVAAVAIVALFLVFKRDIGLRTCVSFCSSLAI